MQISIQWVVYVVLAAAVAGCGGGADDGVAVGVDDLARTAQSIARGEDRVSVQDLSHWLIEGRQDFRLIDCRSAADFAKEHIEGAEHHPLPELVSPGSNATLPRDRPLLVYSRTGEAAAAGAVLMRLQGYQAKWLAGGYDRWRREILHPDIPAEASVAESSADAEKRAITCYFAGGAAAPRPAASAGQATRPHKPAFKPPLSPVGKRRAKKAPPPSGEGC